MNIKDKKFLCKISKLQNLYLILILSPTNLIAMTQAHTLVYIGLTLKHLLASLLFLCHVELVFASLFGVHVTILWSKNSFQQKSFGKPRNILLTPAQLAQTF